MSILDSIKNNATKKSLGLAGGGTALGIVVSLLMAQMEKVENHVDLSISAKEEAILNVVDYKHKEVVNSISNLQDQIKELKELAIRIDNRLYELNKKALYSDLKKDENFNN